MLLTRLSKIRVTVVGAEFSLNIHRYCNKTHNKVNSKSHMEDLRFLSKSSTVSSSAAEPSSSNSNANITATVTSHMAALHSVQYVKQHVLYTHTHIYRHTHLTALFQGLPR